MQGILSKGDAVVVVALFLLAIYLIVKMVVEAMKGYGKTQLLLIEKLDELSTTVKAQTAMIEKQSVIIVQLKEVIHKLYEELINKSKVIDTYRKRNKRTRQYDAS